MSAELRYLYRLDRDVSLYLPESLFVACGLRSEAADWTGRWAQIEPNHGRGKGATLTVRAGYAWDGCSIKWKWRGPFTGALHWLGTPEGQVVPVQEGDSLTAGKPRTWSASLPHDVLYQFGGEIAAAWRIPWHPTLRRFADAVLRYRLRQSRFGLAGVYWAAVRVAGTFMHRDRR